MKNFLVLLFLSTFFIINSCSFKPLYNSNQFFSKYKVEILVKSKDKYENNANQLKNILDGKLNSSSSKSSNLKLIVSINRYESDLGINKNLYTFGKMLTFDVIYSFYDKKGLLTSGKVTNKASYNVTANTYANIVSKEDASKKLILSISKNLSNLILAKDFRRKISP